MIISPCISICKTDPSTGYCYGCGRNNEEKKTWKLEDNFLRLDGWNISDLTISIFCLPDLLNVFPFP